MSHRHLLSTTSETKGWTLPFLQTCLPSYPPLVLTSVRSLIRPLGRKQGATFWEHSAGLLCQGCCSESLLQVEPWGPAQTLVFSAPPTPIGVVMELSPTHSLSTSPFGCHLCLLGHQGWGGPGGGLWSITKAVLASVLGARG